MVQKQLEGGGRGTRTVGLFSFYLNFNFALTALDWRAHTRPPGPNEEKTKGSTLRAFISASVFRLNLHHSGRQRK